VEENYEIPVVEIIGYFDAEYYLLEILNLLKV